MTDREKLVELINQAKTLCLTFQCQGCPMEKEDKGECKEQLMATYLIANGVVIREKGEWEIHPKDTYAKEHGCEKLRCTNCWHFYYRQFGDDKNFCPNCGADLRPTGEDNNG